jgi:hypothetical protein
VQELFTLKVERKGHGTGRKKKKKNGELLPYEQAAAAEDHSDKGKVGKYVKVSSASDKFKRKEEIRDRSGALVEEGEAIFQGFRVTKEDQKRLQMLYKVSLLQIFHANICF